MKRIIIFFLLFALLSVAAFAQERAVLKEISGKVEVKQPGGGWMPASDGMELPMGGLVSTGFNSSVLLDLGSSEIRVRQLTRMSVEELNRQQGSMVTSLDLKVGRVSASVKSVEGLTHDFKLKSPTSTASVRGTEFDFDGFLVRVRDGRVALLSEDGTEELVFEGEISGGEAALSSGFAVSPYTSYSGTAGGIGGAGADDSGFTGSIVIEISS